jgi:hypothetical protein
MEEVVGMALDLTIAGSESEGLVLDLYAWLSEQSEGWGQAQVREGDPVPGALGPVADAVQLVVGSVGAVSSLAAVIVAWLQYRKPDVTVTISLMDQSQSAPITALRANADGDAAQGELSDWLSDMWQAEADSRAADGS